EHVPRFWRGFQEVHRVLRPDGALLVCCPFYFHIHSYPSDYWRFTPEALQLLLADYPSRLLGWHGPPRRPLNVWALAFREQARRPRAAWLQSFVDEGRIGVSVCIANWNCREMLRGCLESLHDQPQGVRLETIVVDNGSSDGAAEMVARDFPEVVLIRNADNR